MRKTVPSEHTCDKGVKMTITFTTNTIRLLTLFENVTNVPVRDCFVFNETVYFIVEQGKIGLAIGKNGNCVKNIERITGKRIKVYEHSPNPEKFIKNLIPQCKEIELTNDNNRIEVQIKVDKKDRGLVIGRGGENIKVYKQILKRIHDISDLTVR